jgi:hypothetical protein
MDINPPIEAGAMPPAARNCWGDTDRVMVAWTLNLPGAVWVKCRLLMSPSSGSSFANGLWWGCEYRGASSRSGMDWFPSPSSSANMTLSRGSLFSSICNVLAGCLCLRSLGLGGSGWKHQLAASTHDFCKV